MKKIFLYFAAGCLGGLVNSMTVWAAGYFGIAKSLGVSIAPALSPEWLYPRIVWGGIWGILFFLPVMKSRAFARGSLMSLFPTLIQLFVIFPYKMNKGMAGIELGLLTPVLVLFYNLVWGVVTSYAVKFSK